MILIVDTNIVFSALLNTQSSIADIIFNPPKSTQLFTCQDLLKDEINRHWPKLLNLSKLPESKLTQSQQLVYARLSFIDEFSIHPDIWKAASTLTNPIDTFDIPFVALTLHLDGYLWTGDKKLRTGLKKQGFDRVVTSQEIIAQRKE
ncbi:MAG: PIN domain-containing protein [Saprospiraceae bacterium]|nr:PIN domain-containing protein [Saprospiraceae bacterium]